MKFLIRNFPELQNNELFEIFKLRAEVFVVEQNCAYQDVDEADKRAFHVISFSEEELIAYCRILPPDIEHAAPRIGRVVVKKTFRNKNLGKELMRFAIQTTKELWPAQQISISAQQYLTKFYRDLGFIEVGEGYLEDDIPHIKMVLNH